MTPNSTFEREKQCCSCVFRGGAANSLRLEVSEGGERPVYLHYPRHVAEVVEVLISSEQIPEYSHPGDAGADLQAAEAVELAPGQRATVGTGVSIALPDGYVAFVVPRSGLASKHGITIVNSPGTVDAGYRGEIRVTLLNTDTSQAYSVAVGDRIAQIIVQPVARARFIAVDHLPGSQRGESGFGSTGYAAPSFNHALSTDGASSTGSVPEDSDSSGVQA